MVRPSDVLVGLFRLALVVFALAGNRHIILDADFHGLVYFTNLTTFAVAATFSWAGLAQLLRRAQPPGWLKGAVTLFAAVTGLVSYFILAPEPANTPVSFLGLTDGQIKHELLPIAVAVDFVLFDAHRRLRLRYAGYWVAVMAVYLAVTLIRGAIDPNAGYPYGFIDVSELGYGGVALNAVLYGVGIYLLGVLLWGVDRLLPGAPIIGSAVGDRS